MNDIQLPLNFAEQLLQLESSLDDNLSMKLITDLNELYRIGIDYYIHHSPRKAQHFQKKMTRLLSDPMTLTVISNQSPGRIRSMRSPQMLSKSKINQQISTFSNWSHQQVSKILDNSEKALQKKKALRAGDLKKQQQNLQNRILLKKCKSQQKTLEFNPRA